MSDKPDSNHQHSYETLLEMAVSRFEEEAWDIPNDAEIIRSDHGFLWCSPPESRDYQETGPSYEDFAAIGLAWHRQHPSETNQPAKYGRDHYSCGIELFVDRLPQAWRDAITKLLW